jgi:hypothetical protein
MIVALQAGKRYPFPRCTKRAKGWACLEPAGTAEKS